MRFSVTFGAVGPGRDPRGLAELARLAEDCGWDAVFLEDYLVYQGDASQPTYDPWICLAAMASATSRIKLGTAVTPVPRRRPWKLAAEAVALDHLSGGRLILGVGIGDPGDPFLTAAGEPSDPRVLAELLDESLEIITALWTGEPVHLRGKHYQLEACNSPLARSSNPASRSGSAATSSSPPSDVRQLIADRGAEGDVAGFDVKVSGGDGPRSPRRARPGGALDRTRSALRNRSYSPRRPTQPSLTFSTET